MTAEEHIAILRALLVRDHEELIAEVQGWADEAAANGDEWTARWHQDHVNRLRAMPYPWEKATAA